MVVRLPALTRRILAVVATAVGLVVLGQAAIQWSLARQRGTHTALGLLARHRVAGVRLVQGALVASNPTVDAAERARARRDWLDAAGELDTLRRALDERPLPRVRGVAERRAALLATEARLLAASAELAAGDGAARPALVAELAAADRRLGDLSLGGWRALREVLDEQLLLVRRVEGGIAVVLLLTLLVGAAVVRPAARASERLMRALLASRGRVQAAHGAMRRERELATSIVHSATEAMFAYDVGLRITAWNPAMQEWTGVAHADAVGRRPEEIAAELDWGAAGRPYARALGGETVEAQEVAGRAAPGEPPRYFDVSCGPVRVADGTISGGLVSVRDVTARVLAAEQVRRSEARFHTLFDQAPLGIVLLDDDGGIVDANGAFGRLVGREPAALRGTPATALYPADDAEAVTEQLREVREGRAAGVSIERRLAHPDGGTVWATLTVRRLDADGAGATLVGMAQDVTARRELETRLSHQAFHDPLTGLANRTRLRDRLERALVQGERDPRAVALIYVDLDDFKKVNDSLGHAAGDQLLRAVAERLLNATRGSDTVARLGGDEFAVLLENVRNDADAVIVAERVANAMRAAFVLDGREVFVGGSVGIARAASETTPEPVSPDELLRNADVAMYHAKRGGKGHHVLYAASMNADAMGRLELESDLRHAQERGELALHYQPIVDLADGRVLGVEALVRWHHPARGLLLPAAFVPLAEETGLIVPLGRWVLGEACRQGAEWGRRAAAPLSMSVNVSARQLRDPALVDDVRAALADSGLPPERLLLELTEGVFIAGDDATLDALRALKGLGVRLGIDDFGTGYASLRYLQQFPVDVLKIDRTFIEALRDAPAAGGDEEGEELAVARAIVSLGESLSLHTIAEGVEVPPQWEQLRRLGCTVGQGHLFGRAVPPDELAPMLGLAVPLPTAQAA
ncbi:EAL domain-containing protein [Roseisolibacter sp. H3M3-2]|uniref:putative bifunctional diguanylate cyclase/phosphodiesterase n=1 Tax=Roseisolibacter sp. H3M3-2 TaxID=3031323 RepID=UPI0023DC4E14|nr:EAL domain-containing protein [Roseisolibacter sp. H3M3-2]MDF1504751.1 EAL domain-containing protein [Roseisolibacter sp. H3M3-2]